MTEQTPAEGGAPRPVPDLGFFGNPTSQAPSHAAPPNQFAPPGQRAVPNQFGPPPIQFGTAPVTPFGAEPPAAYSPYPVAQKRGGMPGWAIALIALGVGFIIVAVLAAVAIPVFLDQRERERVASTTITFPEAVEGLPRSTDAEAQERLQSLLAGMPSGMRDPQGAIYTDGSAQTIVLMSARFPRPAGPADMRDLMAGFDDGLVSNAPPGVTMSEPFEREPGRLGGRIRCATMSGAATGQICMAADSASMLSITELSSASDPDLPRRVREAVVQQP